MQCNCKPRKPRKSIYGERTINYANAGGHRGGRDDYNEDYDDYKPYGGGRGGGDGGGGEFNQGRGWNRRGNGVSGNSAVSNEGVGGPVASAQSSGFSASGYPPQVHFWCSFAGPAIANGHTPPAHMIEGMKAYLLNVGYPLKAVQEIIAASNILASYGVLKPGNIAIFNTPQLQMSNPFNTMAGGGGDALGGMGNVNTSNLSGMDGWNNPMGAFLKQFQQGAANRGGFEYDSGFESSYMSGSGGAGGGGGNYGKHDSNEVKFHGQFERRN